MVNKQGETKMNATAQNVTSINANTEKQLSMTPDAIRRRAKRETEKLLKQAAPESNAVTVAKPKAKAAPRKLPTAAPIKVSAAQKRTIGQVIASLSAGFLPIASFVLAHYESKTQPLLWILVVAALMFSAPTLISWAGKWCGNQYKAVGFTVLLEGVMVFSHTEALSFAGLLILVLINASNAWTLAAQKTQA